jgi:tetratricopeptide (TPR) repeat protein
MRGRELSPRSSYASVESSVYFLLGDYASLVDASRRGVASDPNEWLEYFYLGVGYEGLGQRAEAIPEFEKAVRMSGGDQDASAALAHAYAVAGKRAEAEQILGDLTRKSKDSYVSPYMVASIYAGLGDKDRALENMDKAVRERCLDIVWNLKTDPRIDNLRSDPRFQALWRRVDFPR